MLTDQLKLQRKLDCYWRLGTLAFVAVVFAMTPNMAFATNTFCTVLSTVLSILTGAPARLIATFAICFLGIAAFFGKLNWSTAMLVGVGISLIFGAGALINVFVPGVATTC